MNQKEIHLWNVTLGFGQGEDGVYTETVAAVDKEEAVKECAQDISYSYQKVSTKSERDCFVQNLLSGYVDVRKTEDQFLQDFQKLFGYLDLGVSNNLDDIRTLLLAGREYLNQNSEPAERQRGG